MELGEPSWWSDALKHLAKDELLGPILKKYPEGGLQGKGDVFSTTIRAIVGQQISVLAADAVWHRLETLVGRIEPESIRVKTPEKLASCGLTRSKASYIHGLAVDSQRLLLDDWTGLSDSEIHKHLISFRGIGPWTSEMVCIFALLRPDVFSIGDIGLIKAVKLLEPKALTNDDVVKVAQRWAPYRTAACWFLWRMLDPVPVEY